ncbi:MAG TPA: hypothetical protein VFN67_40815 [Polyangiales bacterium]|nr:hypothetical protein [Polyangiales bacterium]
MPKLLRDTYFVLELYHAPAFIRLARTAEPVRTHDEVVSSLQACRAALQTTDPSELGILIDWRLSPAIHNGESLQQAIHAELEAFAAPFARSAVLLLAAAPAWSSSKLQVFYDEDAAIAHVCV